MNLIFAVVLTLVMRTPPQVTSSSSPPKSSIEGFVLRAGTNEPLANARVTARRTATGAAGVAQTSPANAIPAVTTNNRAGGTGSRWAAHAT
jgi:hypothetical protein